MNFKEIVNIIGHEGLYNDDQLVALEPWPKDVHISGSLKHWERVVFIGEELIGVIWKSEYGVMRDVDYPFDQVVIVLEGTLTLRPDKGAVQNYKEGDIFLYPKGFTGLWEMPDNYKELIIIDRSAWDETEE